MKVFDTYPGGKGADGTFQTLINLIPPHDVFVSGFLGNCAVMRYKLLAHTNVGCDIDKTVIDAWRGSVPLTQIDLFHMSFFDYWKTYGYHFNYPDCLVFLDPPYPMESRKSKSKIYTYEFTDNDHVQLLRLAISMKAHVMICTYDNPLYQEYLSKWHKVSYPSKTRRGVAIETVYMNFVPDGQLHDYRFLGKDFTDRQRIKRKVERHVNKLSKLPASERNAIMQELLTSFK